MKLWSLAHSPDGACHSGRHRRSGGWRGTPFLEILVLTLNDTKREFLSVAYLPRDGGLFDNRYATVWSVSGMQLPESERAGWKATPGRSIALASGVRTASPWQAGPLMVLPGYGMLRKRACALAPREGSLQIRTGWQRSHPFVQPRSNPLGDLVATATSEGTSPPAAHTLWRSPADAGGPKSHISGDMARAQSSFADGALLVMEVEIMGVRVWS